VPHIARGPGLGFSTGKINVDTGYSVLTDFVSHFHILRQNIRHAFEWLGIKVYVFHDRVEIRGFIPTQVMDIPHRVDYAYGGAIISLGRGMGLKNIFYAII
jgi:hypothetical protein